MEDKVRIDQVPEEKKIKAFNLLKDIIWNQIKTLEKTKNVW